MNLCVFYFYRLIGKLTTFLHPLQVFNYRKHTSTFLCVCVFVCLCVCVFVCVGLLQGLSINIGPQGFNIVLQWLVVNMTTIPTNTVTDKKRIISVCSPSGSSSPSHHMCEECEHIRVATPGSYRIWEIKIRNPPFLENWKSICLL